LREAGQGRNPAALSEVSCVLFSIALNESTPKEEDEFRDIDAVEFTCWSFLFLVKRYKEFIRKKWQ
jgi:hypothetical protein